MSKKIFVKKNIETKKKRSKKQTFTKMLVVSNGANIPPTPFKQS
ncbi:MAG TPA: hypothetical protein VMX17_11700 [Candidatus Glassbacteria bacterium]|nr:hypothetical protein [Candidatus Glassbacteria bacterium]